MELEYGSSLEELSEEEGKEVEIGTEDNNTIATFLKRNWFPVACVCAFTMCGFFLREQAAAAPKFWWELETPTDTT